MNKARWEKLRARIAASPKNVRPADLVALVVGAGFAEHPRKGSHRSFVKPPCFHIIGIPTTKGLVPQHYVKEALAAIEACGEAQEETAQE